MELINDITVGPLKQTELPEAEHIFRLAFGTFIGVPDPANFHRGYDYIKTRWKADPESFFGARKDGRLIGSNFGTNWGSVGFFGPLTIHPEFWDRGVGKQLMEPIMHLFSQWGTRHAGLFTFPQSPKHIGLYQRFGFWPRYLTAVMARNVKAAASPAQRLSSLTRDQRQEFLQSCNRLTNQIYDGLDVTLEINSVAQQQLGDTVFIADDSGIMAFAVCHCGEGTEAGPGNCYVKFAAVRPGPGSEETFAKLIAACEALAAERGLSQLIAGVSTARVAAYRQMLSSGFKTQMQGVAMHRANDEGYNRPDAFVIDDWR